MRPISGHAASLRGLLSQGMKRKEIFLMTTNLRFFPTPFKEIYYIPTDDERAGWLISNPMLALRETMAIRLGTSSFYYSCVTAEEFHGISWHSSGEVHIVNGVRSGKIDLQKRIERNRWKKTWRAAQVARILEFYGRSIIFHKGKVEGAKVKRTPYGNFALPSQIKKDRKRFRELAVRPEYVKKLKRLQKQKPIRIKDIHAYFESMGK